MSDSKKNLDEQLEFLAQEGFKYASHELENNGISLVDALSVFVARSMLLLNEAELGNEYGMVTPGQFVDAERKVASRIAQLLSGDEVKRD